MTINLNDTVKFKLTDYGKDIWYHQYDNLNRAAGKEVIKPSYPKVDEDGYTSMQLWCFMELYGPHIRWNAKNVIEPLDLICEDGEEYQMEINELSNTPNALEALVQKSEENENNDVGSPKKQNRSDTIYRQDAIDVAKQHWYKPDIAKALEELPSAQPEQRWIPVSERLPKEGTDVLLAYEKNMVVGNWEDICGDVTWYANSGDGWFTPTESIDNDGIPIAWMPLPEPYRGEKHVND